MFDLVVSHGGNQERGWWDKIRPYSRGRATRERAKARSFGLVNSLALRAFYFDACGFTLTDAGVITLRSIQNAGLGQFAKCPPSETTL